jgi:hypothetical protein
MTADLHELQRVNLFDDDDSSDDEYRSQELSHLVGFSIIDNLVNVDVESVWTCAHLIADYVQ